MEVGARIFTVRSCSNEKPMKEIVLNQLHERIWISDVGSLNFGPGYACEILRCRGTIVVLQGDPLWSVFYHDVFFKVGMWKRRR